MSIKNEHKSEQFLLENGVTVVYEYVPNTQITTVQAWIKTGSANETSMNNGISHFLEHILFKGTENFKPDEIDAVVESHGGSMNAGTSKDYTMYYITLPSEHAKVAFKVISDMIFKASFIPEEIEKEKPVVVQEIQRKFDNPTHEMWTDSITRLFDKTPYMMDIIGTEENINSFTSETLLSYYRSHYHPKKTTLVVVGDIERDIIKDLAYQYFDVQRDAVASEERSEEWQPTLKDNEERVFYSQVAQDYILKAYQVNATAKDGHVYEVLSDILSGGEYSILSQTLKYGKRVATVAAASDLLSKGTGAFFIYMQTMPEGSSNALKELDTVINAVINGGISDEQIQKAKNRLISRSIFQKEKGSSLASEIGYSHTIGIKDYYLTYVDSVQKITLKDVLKAAKDTFESPHLLYKTFPNNECEKL